MSDVFEKALQFTLQYEGSSFTNDPDDPGGATKYGITLGFAQGTHDMVIFDVDNDGDIDINDIKKLSQQEAHDAYKKYFWDSQNLDTYNPKIAFLMFDMSVNHGKKNAAKLLQVAITKCGHQLDPDGSIGKLTLSAMALCDIACLAAALLEARREFYRKIVERRPASQKFIRGWMNRVQLTGKAIDEF